MPDRMRGRRGVARRAGYLRAHPLCVACARIGRVRAAQEVDHVVPLHAGGADDARNLQGLCRPCHAAKTARDAGHKLRGSFGADGNPLPSDDGADHWRR